MDYAALLLGLVFFLILIVVITTLAARPAQEEMIRTGKIKPWAYNHTLNWKRADQHQERIEKLENQVYLLHNRVKHLEAQLQEQDE